MWRLLSGDKKPAYFLGVKRRAFLRTPTLIDAGRYHASWHTDDRIPSRSKIKFSRHRNFFQGNRFYFSATLSRCLISRAHHLRHFGLGVGGLSSPVLLLASPPHHSLGTSRHTRFVVKIMHAIPLDTATKRRGRLGLFTSWLTIAPHSALSIIAFDSGFGHMLQAGMISHFAATAKAADIICRRWGPRSELSLH